MIKHLLDRLTGRTRIRQLTAEFGLVFARQDLQRQLGAIHKAQGRVGERVRA